MLKPGGRFAVSDVVVRGNVPAEIKRSMQLWVGCVAGALSDYEYVTKLAKAGFEHISIEPTRVYSIDNARAFLSGQGSFFAINRGRARGRFPNFGIWVK